MHVIDILIPEGKPGFAHDNMPRVGLNLDPFRDLIAQWYLNDSRSQDEILRMLRNEHDFNTTKRSLQRYLNKWGLQKNELNIDILQIEILDLFNAGLSNERIIDHFQHERPEFNLSLRSLERRLSKWGAFRYDPVTYSPELLRLVQYYFFTGNNTDQEIILQLRHFHNVDVSRALLVRIRIENNMRRKILNEGDRQQLMESLIDFFDNYQRQSDALRDLGRGTLYNLIRRSTNLPYPRDMIWDVYSQRYPEVVQQRSQIAAVIRRDRKFVVPGPNYMWCMDGYQKLRFAGFEIYAGIDAYSRYILWASLDRSSSLALVILYQWLVTVITLKMRSWITRVDHGVETPVMAQVQFQLAMASRPELRIRRSDGTVEVLVQGFRITDSNVWAGSHGNRRIEGWWRFTRQGVTDRWIQYFEYLRDRGMFNRNVTPDLAASYAIYAPLLRRDLHEFVTQWNNHRIRYQPGKNHVIPGHVRMLWQNLDNPDVPNCGVDLTHDPAVLNLAQHLLEPLEGFDFDSFLSIETQQLCDDWLEEHPLGDIHNDPERPHIRSYLALREYLQEYEEQRREPQLAFNELPRGGLAWYRQRVGDMEEHRDNIMNARRDVEENGDPYEDWINAEVLG
ncbi:hypothetical protein F4805DRAFT_451796 [Annulohypoxylon moriforme]|nr:hypothetical protein F4805DRAFT_451796 [Annulohypoxylon moriforme]